MLANQVPLGELRVCRPAKGGQGHRQFGRWRCKLKHPQLRSARTFRVSNRFGDLLIFYQSQDARMEILRVVHGAQDLAALFDKPNALD